MRAFPQNVSAKAVKLLVQAFLLSWNLNLRKKLRKVSEMKSVCEKKKQQQKEWRLLGQMGVSECVTKSEQQGGDWWVKAESVSAWEWRAVNDIICSCCCLLGCREISLAVNFQHKSVPIKNISASVTLKVLILNKQKIYIFTETAITLIVNLCWQNVKSGFQKLLTVEEKWRKLLIWSPNCFWDTIYQKWATFSQLTVFSWSDVQSEWKIRMSRSTDVLRKKVKVSNIR